MDSTKLQKISDSLLNVLLIEKTNSVALKKNTHPCHNISLCISNRQSTSRPGNLKKVGKPH